MKPKMPKHCHWFYILHLEMMTLTWSYCCMSAQMDCLNPFSTEKIQGTEWVWGWGCTRDENKFCQCFCSSPSPLIEFNEVHALPYAHLTERSCPVGRNLSLDCICGCKYGRKSSSWHAWALHSSLLASSSLNCPTESGTDDWAEPGGLEGWKGGEGEESSRARRLVKVPVGLEGESCQDWKLNSRISSAGFVLWIMCGQMGAITEILQDLAKLIYLSCQDNTTHISIGDKTASSKQHKIMTRWR